MLCSTEQDKTFWQILTIKWNAHRHRLVKEEEKRQEDFRPSAPDFCPSTDYPNYSPRCTGQSCHGELEKATGWCVSSSQQQKVKQVHLHVLGSPCPCHLAWGCTDLRARHQRWTNKQTKEWRERNWRKPQHKCYTANSKYW